MALFPLKCLTISKTTGWVTDQDLQQAREESRDYNSSSAWSPRGKGVNVVLSVLGKPAGSLGTEWLEGFCSSQPSSQQSLVQEFSALWLRLLNSVSASCCVCFFFPPSKSPIIQWIHDTYIKIYFNLKCHPFQSPFNQSSIKHMSNTQAQPCARHQSKGGKTELKTWFTFTIPQKLPLWCLLETST